MEIIITSVLVLSGLVNIYLVNKYRQEQVDNEYLRFNLSLSVSTAKAFLETLKEEEQEHKKEIREFRKKRKKLANKLYKQISYYKKWYLFI